MELFSNKTVCSLKKHIPNKLLRCLSSQRNSGELCDVKFCIGSIHFPAHSCVLASFSPYLRDIFMYPSDINKHSEAYVKKRRLKVPTSIDISQIRNGWSLKHPLEVSLLSEDLLTGSCCIDCVLKVIDFMYLGKISVQKDHFEHVKYMGELLEVSELLLICEKFSEKYGLEVHKQAQDEPPDSLKKKPKLDSSVEEETKQTSLKSVTVEGEKSSETYAPQESVCEVSDVNKNSQLDVSHTSLEPNTSGENASKNVLEPQFGISSSNKDVKIDINTSASEDCATENAQNFLTNPNSDSGQHSCKRCKENFSSSNLLQEHRRLHMGRLYSCLECQYQSQKAWEFVKHLLNSDHELTVCSLCLFESDSVEKLKAHVELHSHPKPFFCTTCNLRFQTRTGLNLHTPTHSSAMHFFCPVCERGFKWKHSLTSHMVVHTTEKKHLCAQCGFSTAHKSTFNAHELSHKGPVFCCPQLDCTFKTQLKNNLRAHLETHKKEKPYQCEICGQSFSQAKNLRRHAQLHSLTTYADHCTLCLFRSTRFDKLIEHFKKHHPDGDFELLKRERAKLAAKREKSKYLHSSLPTTPTVDLQAKCKKINVNVDISKASLLEGTGMPIPTLEAGTCLPTVIVDTGHADVAAGQPATIPEPSNVISGGGCEPSVIVQTAQDSRSTGLPTTIINNSLNTGGYVSSVITDAGQVTLGLPHEKEPVMMVTDLNPKEVHLGNNSLLTLHRFQLPEQNSMTSNEPKATLMLNDLKTIQTVLLPSSDGELLTVSNLDSANYQLEEFVSGNSILITDGQNLAGLLTPITFPNMANFQPQFVTNQDESPVTISIVEDNSYEGKDVTFNDNFNQMGEDQNLITKPSTQVGLDLDQMQQILSSDVPISCIGSINCETNTHLNSFLEHFERNSLDLVSGEAANRQQVMDIKSHRHQVTLPSGGLENQTDFLKYPDKNGLDIGIEMTTAGDVITESTSNESNKLRSKLGVDPQEANGLPHIEETFHLQGEFYQALDSFLDLNDLLPDKSL